MNYENICFAAEGNIARVTLNRPQCRNALSLALMRELIDCLSVIGARRDLRVVILAAAGSVFPPGLRPCRDGRSLFDAFRAMFDVCTELMVRLQSIRACDRRSPGDCHRRRMPARRHMRSGRRCRGSQPLTARAVRIGLSLLHTYGGA